MMADEIRPFASRDLTATAKEEIETGMGRKPSHDFEVRK
jgi:hypothetical protein